MGTRSKIDGRDDDRRLNLKRHAQTRIQTYPPYSVLRSIAAELVQLPQRTRAHERLFLRRFRGDYHRTSEEPAREDTRLDRLHDDHPVDWLVADLSRRTPHY